MGPLGIRNLFVWWKKSTLLYAKPRWWKKRRKIFSLSIKKDRPYGRSFLIWSSLRDLFGFQPHPKGLFRLRLDIAFISFRLNPTPTLYSWSRVQSCYSTNRKNHTRVAGFVNRLAHDLSLTVVRDRLAASGWIWRHKATIFNLEPNAHSGSWPVDIKPATR